MSRAIVTICFLFAISGDLPIAGTSTIIFEQPPRGDTQAIISAALSDRSCDSACTPPISRAHAAAAPGTDLLSLSFRINEVEVWGSYRAAAGTPGTPPTEDSFTVRVHVGNEFDGLPGPAICSLPGIVGTREVVGQILGFDIHHHTLPLPEPCVVVVPGNRVMWIEVFNDTGPADDWYWVLGLESPAWPVDCCDQINGYGTAIDPNNAPGVNWGPVFFTPLAFALKTIHVGETQDLRLSKAPADALLLEWDGDCGGGGEFSVYRGSLADGYDSLAPESDRCDLTGTSATVPAGAGAADFFLVAPWVAVGAGAFCDPADDECRRQGSYGADSDGVARPEPANRCYEQANAQAMNDCAP